VAGSTIQGWGDLLKKILEGNWTAEDYGRALDMLSKAGGIGGKPSRPAGGALAMPQLPQGGPNEWENPGPVFGENLLPSTLDVWRPKQRNTLFPGNPYG
jgi:hypothetical protein